MKCMNCGADIPDADQFCGKCGWTIGKTNSKKTKNKRDTYNDTYNKEEKKHGYDIMTVMSTTIAFLIVTVAASIIFVLVINLTKGSNNNESSNASQGMEAASDSTESDDVRPDTDVSEEAVLNTESHEQLQEQTVGTLTIVSDVNIRDNPDTDNSNVIKVAKASETYEYLGLADYGNWYIILLEDGTKGYVYKGYVSAD